MIYLWIPFLMDMIRLYAGPFPEFLCWWNIYFKNFSALGTIVGFTNDVLLRVRSNSTNIGGIHKLRGQKIGILFTPPPQWGQNQFKRTNKGKNQLKKFQISKLPNSP